MREGLLLLMRGQRVLDKSAEPKLMEETSRELPRKWLPQTRSRTQAPSTKGNARSPVCEDGVSTASKILRTPSHRLEQPQRGGVQRIGDMRETFDLRFYVKRRDLNGSGWTARRGLDGRAKPLIHRVICRVCPKETD